MTAFIRSKSRLFWLSTAFWALLLTAIGLQLPTMPTETLAILLGMILVFKGLYTSALRTIPD